MGSGEFGERTTPGILPNLRVEGMTSDVLLVLMIAEIRGDSFLFGDCRRVSHGLVVSGANPMIRVIYRQICDYPTWDEIRRCCHFRVIFICFVPKTGTRLVTMDVLVAMHGRQDRTTPDYGIARTFFHRKS